MRVLQLGRFWKLIGGVQLHAQALCRSLSDLGVDVVDLVASEQHRRSDQMVDGYRMVEAASFGVYFSTSISPDLIRLARRLHRESPFDLVHLHFPDPMSHLVSMCLPSELPRVITWHSDIIKQKHLLKIYRPWQRRETLRAQAIIAPTEAHFTSSRQIPDEYPARQRHVIPFGLDHGRFQVTAATQSFSTTVREKASGKFVVFALGRHVEYKGFGFLVAAMRHCDAFLVLGGDGPLNGSLREEARNLGVEDRIWFTGTLSDTEVAACYHACDVFCLPSITTNEAFGLVQLEAMACQKPVICTQLGNGVNALNPDGVTGLTVPVGDAIALAGALEQLRLDPVLRHRLGQQAAQHVSDHYSMDAMGRHHVALYRRLIDAASGQ